MTCPQTGQTLYVSSDSPGIHIFRKINGKKSMKTIKITARIIKGKIIAVLVPKIIGTGPINTIPPPCI
jgi:hypothetical protein